MNKTPSSHIESNQKLCNLEQEKRKLSIAASVSKTANAI